MISFSLGCASLSTDNSTISLSGASKVRRKVVFAKQMQLVYPKKMPGTAGFKCTPKDKAPTSSVVLLNVDGDLFKQNDFCQKNPLALLFMGETFNYEVLALNRPGFDAGGILGLDFNGPATSAGLEDLVKSLRAAPLIGIWAAGGATISAIELSRRMKGIEWLVLGGGFYDMELFTKEARGPYVEQITSFMEKSPDVSKFQELRSPAWNPTGLPQNIYLYHGKKDQVIPWGFSKSFKDTLAAEEKNTREFFEEDLGHELTMDEHALITEGLLKGG